MARGVSVSPSRFFCFGCSHYKVGLAITAKLARNGSRATLSSTFYLVVDEKS